MFEKGYAFYGQEAHMFNEIMQAGYFERNTDVLSWVAFVGYACQDEARDLKSSKNEDTNRNNESSGSGYLDAQITKKSIQAENVEVRNVKFSFEVISFMDLVKSGHADQVKKLVFGQVQTQDIDSEKDQYLTDSNNVTSNSCENSSLKTSTDNKTLQELKDAFREYASLGLVILHSYLCPSNLKGKDPNSMSVQVERARLIHKLMEHLKDQIMNLEVNCR